MKAWLNAARLRTLPLSISGILVGTALAGAENANNYLIFTLALLTTVCFQVTSNFANDYGDGVKGTDNEDRIGPKRALQSGILTQAELKKGIIISIIISLVFVVLTVLVAFGLENLPVILLFLGLGVASIWAAIKYTVGNSAYGYKGLGDVFVFLFFGLLAVLGSMFLYTEYITIQAVLPAITIGFMSTGVLNLNNLRDHISDKKAGKNTLVVLMGYNKGKIYHYTILITAVICMLFYVFTTHFGWQSIVVTCTFIPTFIHLNRVRKTKNPVLLDPELKKLALNTFLVAIVFYFCYNKFL